MLGGDPVAEVERLKEGSGGDLLDHGGSGLAGTLSAAGLIDEYHLMLRPVALQGLFPRPRLDQPGYVLLIAAGVLLAIGTAKDWAPAD